MTDRKKIYDAAMECGDSQGAEVSAFVANGFRLGVDWFRGNVWHDAKEKPREWEDCLVELETYRNTCRTSYNRTATRYAVAYMRCSQWDESNFPTQNYDIRRWCYVKDMLPDGEKD